MAKSFQSVGGAPMFQSGTTVRPAYGYGSREYGINGVTAKGRVQQVQFREQNSGMAPAEDYSPAKFLPGLWRDLDRNGCPYVIAGGTVLGVAGVVTASGEYEYVLAHNVMPANAGVPQKLVYDGDKDLGVAIDIDTMVSGTSLVTSPTAVSGAKTSTLKVIGNKPLAYTPTNVLSTAWSDVFINQKYEQSTTMKTQWLAMYPVSDKFMYGGAITTDGTPVSVSTGVGVTAVPSSQRTALGFADVTVGGAAISLAGIAPGDYVMPNPYLPGKLISVDDFVTLGIKDTGGTIYGSTGLNGFLAAQLGTALSDNAAGKTAIRAYAMEHVVGRCFKRQSRAQVDGSGIVVNKDIYADVLSYLAQIPDLNLQGTSTKGIEANQEDARQLALAMQNAGIDVVFINFNTK